MRYQDEYTATMSGEYTEDENDIIHMGMETIRVLSETLEDLGGVRLDIVMDEEGQGYNITLDRELTDVQYEQVNKALDHANIPGRRDWDVDETTILIVITWSCDVDIAY